MTAKLIEDRHGDNVLIYIEGKSVWIDCNMRMTHICSFAESLTRKAR